MHPRAVIAALRGRVRALRHRGAVERELADEIRFHLEMETERNLRAGMSATEARRAARLAFGGVDRIMEEHRDARGTRLIEDALADLRYAARTLARSPGFVAISVLTLAIAIAVGTSLFTAVNGFFYRPLPVPAGDELLAVFTSEHGARDVRGGSSYADLASFAQATVGVAELAGQARITLAVGDDDSVALVPGALVSSDYFRMLRMTPALGGIPAGARADEPTIVLGHALWRRTFASDPAIVGRQVRVNGHFFRVAAVAPAGFMGARREVADEFWIDAAFAPLVLPLGDVLHERDDRRFHLFGRLRDGASVDELRARLALAAARLHQEEPATWSDSTGRGHRVTVMYEREALLAGVARGDLLLVVGGVIALGFGLLALASTNLASMQLARAAARRHEIATRLALGAGRRRLVRQLLTESTLIAVPGALLGLGLASAVTRVAMHHRPAGLPNVDLSLDVRALLLTSVGVLLAALVFGLVPALQGVRGEVLSDLKGGEPPGRGGLRIGGVRGGLIVAQVALSVMFTAGSGLVAFALVRHAEESRVEAGQVLVAPLTLLPAAGDSSRAATHVREVVDAVGRLPGVEAASAARHVPVPGARTTTMIEQRDEAGAGGRREVDVNPVLPRYFDVTGLPLLRGRDFDERDLHGSMRTAIVSSAMAEALWPGADPIGRWLRVGRAEDDVEIVGVVGELRSAAARTTGMSSGGMLYLPLRPQAQGTLVLHVRTAGPATALAPGVAAELRLHGTRVAAPDVLPMDRHMARALLSERITARAAGILAALQMLLAVAGLTGVVAHVTALRRREIGIRAALGAERRSILALVMRQGIRLTAIGGAIGILLGLGLGRVVATMLPVTAAIELRALAIAAIGLALVAGVSMAIPARRALAVAPATALRVD